MTPNRALPTPSKHVAVKGEEEEKLVSVYKDGCWQTAAEFIEEIESLECYEIQPFFEKEWDGGCPCFNGSKSIGGETFEVDGRCWRISEHDQDLHVSGTLPSDELERIAQVIKTKLDERQWYMDYTIIRDWEETQS